MNLPAESTKPENQTDSIERIAARCFDRIQDANTSKRKRDWSKLAPHERARLSQFAAEVLKELRAGNC